ncbi:MAG: RsmE family RNA methyltransferase [Reichenbachiella sp.]|uniref:RsmE family RNA methyltransferase n=1 Tax=Reichenbachiella sp. TaxID=2184521 RepID=UPI003265EFC9
MNFYYHPNPEEYLFLSAEESGHVVKVLRGKSGDQFTILDGKGHSYIAEITDPKPKACAFKIIDKTAASSKEFRIHLAIAPTKSTDRLEWFVEKACELGVDEISILSTQRTERKRTKTDRLNKKAISALKQSKNVWKCQINEPQDLKKFANLNKRAAQKFVAYVETGDEDLLQHKLDAQTEVLILIGPEGDFSPEEIDLLKNLGYELVSLGQSVLRTETAGIVAVHTVNMVNQAI